MGKNWLPSFTNPSKQAKRNAATLSHVLSTHNIKQWITPIVIWANPDAQLMVENADVSIWHLFQVADELEKLQGGRAMPEEQRVQIVEIMKGFYRQPFVSDNG